MGVQGGCQKLNKSREKVCTHLDRCKGNEIVISQVCTMHTEKRNLDGRPGTRNARKCTCLLCLMLVEETLLTNLWPNCSYHCTHICIFEESKQTAVVVVDGQLKVLKNMMNCLW
jgi:hypothetical protein